ncbi:hypothetical protein [Bifidobacterium magnum]|uniref:Uncharacterized protein n=1 Tax=Bifidobacterium magnum TaxID=1692 RepID=A0A087BEK6_9BIFI|nr:hypothetical protein [Bifidobacterium magnum]KFI69456.1 hypothetical protein BMAGN_1161 [Bifidobacterium magnum]
MVTRKTNRSAASSASPKAGKKRTAVRGGGKSQLRGRGGRPSTSQRTGKPQPKGAKKRLSAAQRNKRAMFMRRRIMLILAALVAIFCVFSLIRGFIMIGQNIAAGDTSSSRSAVPQPKATSKVPMCGKDDIDLTLTPNTTTVGVGGSVTFTAKITYVGNSAEGCFVDGEDDNRVLTITSGNNTVWRSDACPSTYRPLLVYKGGDDEQKIVWNTNASGDECVADADLPHVQAGTYVAKLVLKDDDTVVSDPVSITVQ